MIKRPRVVPSVSAAEIAPEIAKLSRRGLLRKGLSLGGLALLTGLRSFCRAPGRSRTPLWEMQ